MAETGAQTADNVFEMEAVSAEEYTAFDRIKDLGASRLLVIGLIFFLFVAFFSYMIWRAMQPGYTLLFSGLDLQDSQEITSRITALNIPFRLSASGDAIMVPSDKALELRMQLAEDGMPVGGIVGYEIFDSLDTFGTTDFLSNLNLRRALEGELSRTIASIRSVRSARVHLVSPERALFSREQASPSASVFLSVSGRGLANRQAAAIRHLVASAVQGLSPAAVTILDDNGTLLARSNEEMGGFAFDEATQYQNQLEEQLRHKIVMLLERTIGVGKVDAIVTAVMNFDEVSTTQEIFDPSSQVARSTQTVEEEADLDQTDPQSQVSVDVNLPNNGNAGGGDSGRSLENSARTEETVNYEISRTVRNETRRGGQLSRLSIAVQVDGLYETGPDGETVFSPRSEEEIAELQRLVTTAAGLDESRGDTISIVSRRIIQPEAAPEQGFQIWDYLSSHMIRLIELLAILLGVLMVVTLGIRPMMKRLLPDLASIADSSKLALVRGRDGKPMLVQAPPEGAIEITEDGKAIVHTSVEPEEEAVEEAVEERISMSQIEGSVKLSLVNDVAEIIESKPDDAVRIIRSWLLVE